MFICSHIVFRELLQNSSDSGSKRVEIHFKTKSYLDRKTDEADANTQGSEENWRLPDLKTTLVILKFLKLISTPYFDWAGLRFINGLSRTMVCYSETKTGVDSRRSVCVGSIESDQWF